MRFIRHLDLEGKHSFLSASNNAWSNYDEDKLDRVYQTHLAARRGVELHALAAELIRLGVKVADTQTTFNMYVNDCIGFRMSQEQALYYSDNAFGTADAISFRDNVLRIFDYKSGFTHVSIRQLEIYAAYFCLEYRYKPFEIEMEFRIYQNDEVQIYAGDPDVILHLMNRIVAYSKRIDEIKAEAFG